MEEFVYLIRPKREKFIENMTPEESTIIENHFEYLQNLLAEQKLVLAGPCLDGAFGIVIIRAASLEEARQIMENDPAVAEGVMNPELRAFHVSLLQGQ